jgi:hypothetical protein
MTDGVSDPRRRWVRAGLPLLLVLAGMLLFALGYWTGGRVSPETDGATVGAGSLSDPLRATPNDKLAVLSDDAFARTLFDESTALEARLARPGTQVHMGFYSGPGNHGNLVRLLDDINNYTATDGVVHKAVWDEGVTSSLQLPSYVRMNREAWYERAYPVDGKAVVYGIPQADFVSVTPEQADAVWGQFSRRYTGQAPLFKEATGRSVDVWCFVQGAKANRIFYTNEFVALRRLEAEGVVNVHFAKSADADWTDPADWTLGTANHPPALGE